MIIISLGANVTSRWGNAANTILEAFRHLERNRISVIRRSALYVTAPLGVTDQPAFINAAAVVHSALPPKALLTVLKKIEAKAGRKRTKRWGPRVLDLDIIDYKSRIVNWSKRGTFTGKNKPLIVLPHPQVQHRPFVLQPLHDVAPRWHHPVFGQPAAYYLARLRQAKGGKILDVVNEAVRS